MAPEAAVATSSVAQSIPTDSRVLVADFEREHRNSLARASLDTCCHCRAGGGATLCVETPHF